MATPRVPQLYPSTPSQMLDSLRPAPAKAVLAVNDGQSEFRPLITEAIRRVSSQKAAAIDMGIDPAQLTRQLQNGHLTVERLEKLGPEYAAEFGRLLLEQYGPLSTPQARAKAAIREVRRLIDELDQVLEHIA